MNLAKSNRIFEPMSLLQLIHRNLCVEAKPVINKLKNLLFQQKTHVLLSPLSYYYYLLILTHFLSITAGNIDLFLRLLLLLFPSFDL